jgi:RNA 3'-terminal phosphate cyclase
VIKIDGSEGEGGGQILRSALCLAVYTGQGFKIEHIRARREKPGLLRQHVTAAKAAAAISGPGNALVLTLEYAHLTEVFTGFGERGHSAENVAAEIVGEVREYLAHEAPVGPHLADQLLLPMALGGLTRFRTCEPTMHFKSNAEVIHAFTGRRIRVEREDQTYVVSMR